MGYAAQTIYQYLKIADGWNTYMRYIHHRRKRVTYPYCPQMCFIKYSQKFTDYLGIEIVLLLKLCYHQIADTAVCLQSNTTKVISCAIYLIFGPALCAYQLDVFPGCGEEKLKSFIYVHELDC